MPRQSKSYRLSRRKSADRATAYPNLWRLTAKKLETHEKWVMNQPFLIMLPVMMMEIILVFGSFIALGVWIVFTMVGGEETISLSPTEWVCTNGAPETCQQWTRR